MKNKILTTTGLTGLILVFILLFFGFATNSGNTLSRNYYYSGYSWQGAVPNYAAGYGSHGLTPRSMPSRTCSSLFGCRISTDSHIYIGNALDNAYYQNPSLLEPRYMNNQARYYKGLWPQRFNY